MDGDDLLKHIAIVLLPPCRNSRLPGNELAVCELFVQEALHGAEDFVACGACAGWQVFFIVAIDMRDLKLAIRVALRIFLLDRRGDCCIGVSSCWKL